MPMAKKYLHGLLGIWRKIKSLRISDSHKAMRPCDVIVCCADSDRTEDWDGLAYSRVVDSFSEELRDRGLDVQSFAWPYSLRVGANSWGGAYSANRFFFLNALRSRLVRSIYSWPSGETASIGFYSEMLLRTGAKSIVGIGLPSVAIKAAKLNRVRSVEILHGYGYTLMPPGWEAMPAQALPDRIIVFDDVSAKTFGVLRKRGVEIVRIENLWYRKFRDENYVRRLPASWRAGQNWLPKGKRVVLVSLSWGYDNDHGVYAYLAGILRNGLFPDVLTEVIRTAGDDYYWIFRLHPVQLQSERAEHYKRMLNDLCRRYANCEWVMATKTPLPLLLKRCDAHITMISMTAYDAAFMGVVTLLLCPTLKSGGANEAMFSDLKTQGYAEIGEMDSRDIVRWLQSPSRRREGYEDQSGSKFRDPVCAVM